MAEAAEPGGPTACTDDTVEVAVEYLALDGAVGVLPDIEYAADERQTGG